MRVSRARCGSHSVMTEDIKFYTCPCSYLYCGQLGAR